MSLFQQPARKYGCFSTLANTQGIFACGGQIYFGFEVDENGDRLYGAVDLLPKRDDISEERKLLFDNTARFRALKFENVIL
jgi:hypothetical protein